MSDKMEVDPVVTEDEKGNESNETNSSTLSFIGVLLIPSCCYFVST